MNKFVFPTFKYNDYAISNKTNITCRFQYAVLIYDQICDCSNDLNYYYSYQKCKFGDTSNLGFINLNKNQFKRLINDSGLVVDSTNKNDTITKNLLLILKNWFNKISNIRFNFKDVKTSKLKLYNTTIIDNIIKNINLHPANVTDDNLSKFHNLNQLVIDIEVDINGTTHNEIKNTKLNLMHINYLIYKFLIDTYSGCGFYLGDVEVNSDNIPFVEIEDENACVYCHMYLIPLNLPPYYFND